MGSRPARPAANVTPRVRLTRRGRRVIWAAAVLLVMAAVTPLLLMLATGVQAANHGVPASAVRSSLRHVVVKPGQSLWTIALQAEPQADPRIVTRQIIQLNALSSDVVVPGESLWVPQG
jgi:LysM repeat protein